MTKIKPFRKIEGTRAPNQLYNYTHAEKVEHAKCYNSVEYFIENYVKYKAANMSLRDYQKSIIQHHLETKFSIELFSRQVGADTVMAAVYLWHMMFHGKTIMHISIKNAEALYDKIFDMYRTVPSYLQAGLRSIERGKNISFENGGHMKFKSYGKYVAIGSNYNMFVLDSAALSKHFQTTLINIQPIIQALKNCCLTVRSVPNGINYFYDLVDGAERKDADPKKNLFSCKRVYWWEVPGRDAKWREEQIKILGSVDLFNQEYDLQFYGISKG